MKGLVLVINWIKKKIYLVWFISGVVLFLCGLTGCAGDKNSEWSKTSSTAVASQTYLDDAGNKIVYYCCKTTYHNGASGIQDGMLDRQALSSVIDLDRIDNGRECHVGYWPATLCQKNGRSYLCWTISPEYSCVIEYDAGAVAEEDIFHMAESVVQKR